MLPDIEKLLQLQVADKEIRKLQEEIAALPKRVAAIEQKLAGTKAQLEKARTAAKGDEVNRKKFEAAIKDLQGKISKYRDQSLEVKTNEQYKALLHEIQFAEQEIRLNEDRILEVMVNAETRDREVKAAEAELKAETAEIEKEKEEARKITVADQAKLSEWNAKRDGLRQGIAAHAGEQVLIAIPVDVSGADQSLELFRLQLLAGGLPLQLSDDLLHVTYSPNARAACSLAARRGLVVLERCWVYPSAGSGQQSAEPTRRDAPMLPRRYAKQNGMA